MAIKLQETIGIRDSSMGTMGKGHVMPMQKTTKDKKDKDKEKEPSTTKHAESGAYDGLEFDP